jgi:glycosidase
MFEFHISRLARDKYEFDEMLFSFDGNIIFANLLAARQFTQKMNQKRDLVNFPENAIKASEINAMGLIDEILHLVISLYRQQIDPKIMSDAYEYLQETFGEIKVRKVLLEFVTEYPPIAVYNGKLTEKAFLEGKFGDIPHSQLVLEEILMLWITNRNPATAPFFELFDDTALRQGTIYRQMMDELHKFFTSKPHFGPDDEDLYTLLRSPAIAEPYSLADQLEYIRRKWGFMLGDYLYRLLNSIDFIKEESKGFFPGTGPTLAPNYFAEGADENFSPDSDWMPRTVMIAKNSFVWLHQLSKKYGIEINNLDQIPDEELEQLSNWGFNGLWLIGLWERSEASRQIKQLCGNPDAVASAYSLKNYAIAKALGGEDAYQRLKEKASRYGIRLASDMVPNHMGIDSDWVVQHPDWFISLPYSPFPAYSFSGPNLSPVEGLTIKIEDHYYDRTDAAVVFLRVDHNSDDTRFIYHGNDGTSMPWNDTAQLNYLNEEVREAVIQTILHVARKFPIIRFDAAMTLAKKHYQRLWFPQPGTGGDIASRSEYGISKEQFDQIFPKEFWREVVDRVAQEVPDTLLLAEAFWLMEGYFVRTLGMHRVYNSAFMNKLRNEENQKYRQLIKNTIEFDSEILKRYVNFMNNPDEKTAVDQFGKGDKYFGICTLMATMPGLPMFGHGQIEGFAEKYGMEYYRPYWEENEDPYLVHRHQREIFPLLKRRDLFSGVQNFLLYDFYSGKRQVAEDVFAYSNGAGNERALVIYNNRFGSTAGWIHTSASYLNKETGRLENQLLHEGLNLLGKPEQFVIFKDNISQMEFIRSLAEVMDKGLYFQLDAYNYSVLMDFRIVNDNEHGQYAQLNAYLNGRGVPSIHNSIKELILSPILQPLRELINPGALKTQYQLRLREIGEKFNFDQLQIQQEKIQRLLFVISEHINGSENMQPIMRQMQKSYEALLALHVFEEHYPFPQSKNYLEALKFTQKNLEENPFAWYVLLMWNDLRLIGRVKSSQKDYPEIGLSWMEEWGISKIVQTTFEDLGYDEEEASRGLTILRLLINQQNWIMDQDLASARRTLETWLSSDEIRRFLNINRYKEILWFNKEAFEALLWWMMTIGLLSLTSEPDRSHTEIVEKVIQAFQLIKDLLIAEEASEYQVEKLLEALK